MTVLPAEKQQWLFFDIGSTIIDESQAYDRRAKKMLTGTGISFAEFEQKQISFAKQGFDGNAKAVEFWGLKKTPWPAEEEFPYPDAGKILSYLSKKGYPLGIIANQAPGVVDRLEKWELRDFFAVIVSSAEFGFSKPDLRIFRKALESAGCKPEHSVMIGDRLDNDILPAKKLGMHTVWIRQGLSSYCPRSAAYGIADVIVGSLSELQSIF